MNDKQLVLVRDMNRLPLKLKLAVLYGLKEYEVTLIQLRNKCKTCGCTYSLVPIFIKQVNSKKSITKIIKSRISGYNNKLDKVCIIGPASPKFEDYIAFDSVSDLENWLNVN